MSYITKEFYNNQESRRKATQIIWEIAQRLTASGIIPGHNVAITAYLLSKASQDIEISELTVSSILNGRLDIPEEILHFVKESNSTWLSEEVWARLLPLATNYCDKELALAALISDYTINAKFTQATPESVIKLIQKILNIQSCDRVADLCCGTGAFLVSESLAQTDAAYYGCDISIENVIVTKMRMQLVNANVKVESRDVFDLAKEANKITFDKVFCNYPFCVSFRSVSGGVKYMQHLSDKYPDLAKKTSSDWVFNAALCDLLSEEGKAVAIMTNGSAQNSSDISMRKYFTERYMIECVITLPKRMFAPYTSIGTTLIVFSHGNNTIRMIDATKLCQHGRRQNEFSDDDIEEIINALHADSEFSKSISLDKLRANEYNLSLERYIKDAPKFDNGVPFESIIKSITRGASITASQLDAMVSNEVTNVQYLMLANIQNGMIDNNLPYLSNIDTKYDKYCLKNNDIILSKNGYPYKVAVATVTEGQKILANGNLYIIELDEKYANPYYIQAFFDSEQGVAALRSISVGTTILNIGIDKLKGIIIPLPPMKEQIRIAQRYQATLDEISVLRIRLERAIDKLHYVFDEECDSDNA